ncbi:MAG TPA: permease [Chloroflexota bacterium]|nr:permease [Chloroflexota bacterium]
MFILDEIARALSMSVAMFWQILWPLILGFGLSAIVQALVSKALVRLLGDDSAKSITRASLFGIASSSCSYAAIALARSLFRKGANFTAAMAFQFASTNLVIELGIIMVILLGWQFTAAEFVGGPIMIAILWLLLRATLRPRLVQLAQRQAEKGLLGKMEGHAEMDMAVVDERPLLARAMSPQGFTSISQYFVMDWMAVWKDIAGGLLIAGAIAAWVPDSFWRAFFLSDHPTLALFWGPLIGPLVAIVSFVCSVGNVPLAAVLWNGGISFGGVVSFIFADLIILPILDIYRKYYGGRMALYLLGTFYVTMVAAGLIVELLFGAVGLVPTTRQAIVPELNITLNYDTVLNIIFLAVAAVLVWRFLRSGGAAMLRMMDQPMHQSLGEIVPSPAAAGEG